MTALVLAPPTLASRSWSPHRLASAIADSSDTRAEAPTATASTKQEEGHEARLLDRVRDGDEEAFRSLVSRYHRSLKNLARSFGAPDAVAEEVVQETWLAALEGLDRFEGRSSLRTWLFQILKNQARQRGRRERRSLPFSSLGVGEFTDERPVIEPTRFQGPDGCWPSHWAEPPRPWEDPQRRLASLEARQRIKDAMGALPPAQRVVVALRDVDGLSADEVCELLEISDANQRVLLHRGRSAVRRELEDYVDG